MSQHSFDEILPDNIPDGTNAFIYYISNAQIPNWYCTLIFLGETYIADESEEVLDATSYISYDTEG